jgi:hypothetical protein
MDIYSYHIVPDKKKCSKNIAKLVHYQSPQKKNYFGQNEGDFI